MRFVLTVFAGAKCGFSCFKMPRKRCLQAVFVAQMCLRVLYDIDLQGLMFAHDFCAFSILNQIILCHAHFARLLKIKM